ncbi:MAG: membrane dipeptidase [Firmicutes bacterium]|nr:membrane dipeptidase [Bacillota bacterium]
MANRKLKIADCHCDTISLLATNDYDFSQRNSRGHIDLPRLLEGEVKLQFFAVCVAPEKQRSYLQSALEHIARYHRCLAANREHMISLEKKEDLLAAQREGKIAALLALEGAEPLEGSTELLDIFYRLGMRALSLTWNHRNLFADGAGEESAGGGLTCAGKALIRELSGKGIILDLAHLSNRCFFEALELTDQPPLVSHANARRLCDHPRNLDDEQLKALANRGGVIGLSLYPYFITGEAKAGLEQLLDHFVHIAGLIGVEHLAFGSDFDGIPCTIEEIKDVSGYPSLPQALCRRGFNHSEVEMIAWDNVNRILTNNIGDGKS